MKVVNKNIKDLVRADYNPRKINPKELDDLKESVVKFGITEPCIVNINSERENIVISGHQRLTILEELEKEKAPCIEVDLSLEDEKELNIRMNKNGGSFDENLLNEFFDKADLIDWGFKEDEFEDITNVDEAVEDIEEDPVYPIVQNMSEKYDYIIIFSENEVDNAYMNSLFEIEKEQSYKKQTIGVGKVVKFEKFKKILDERSS